MQDWHSVERGKLTPRKPGYANPSEIWTISGMLSFEDLTYTTDWIPICTCILIWEILQHICWTEEMIQFERKGFTMKGKRELKENNLIDNSQ